MTLGLEMRVDEASAAGQARRGAVALAERLGFDETGAGKVATVVTEAATNLVKHAQGGEIYVRAVRGPGGDGIAMLAVDRGPGIRDVGASMADGYSTAGSPGTGLGAIRRLSTEFDLYSDSHGTLLLSQIAAREWFGPRDAIAIGGLSVPYPGETLSGDAWEYARRDHGLVLLVVDGLGHGPGAAEAADTAAGIFRAHSGEALVALLERIHDGLRSTRGAAGAIVEIDAGRRIVRFCGVGNVAGSILSGDTSRSMVSHHGTLGGRAHRIREFTYPWDPGSIAIVHTDGISARGELVSSRQVLAHHPLLIAGAIHREHRRGRDDATVVVLSEVA